MSPRPAVCLLLALTTVPVGAAGWFETRDQEGERLAGSGRHAEAASAFEDPYRRGVSLYRAEDYPGAARAFEQVQRPERRLDARYNLGNARFRQGDLEGAAAAWTEVLQDDPKHEDASHNLAVARALLAGAEAQRKGEKQQAQPAQQQDAKEPSGGQQQSGQQSQDSQQQSGQPSQDSQQQSGQQSQDSQQQSGQQSQDSQQQSGQQSQGSQQQSGQQSQDSQQQSGGQGQGAQQSAGGDGATGQGDETGEGAGGSGSSETDGRDQDAGKEQQGDRPKAQAQERAGAGDASERSDMSTTGEAGRDDNASQPAGGERAGGEAEERAGPGGDRPEGQPGAGKDSRDGNHRPGGRQKGADQFRAEVADTARGVDRFEAAGKPGDAPEGDVPGGMMGGEEKAKASLALLEQLLEQAEGAPAYLLRNQFRLEEHRAMRNRGGLNEPRPW
jgi:Ca-activated chloride channel family protein